jgi:subtilase family serine protease
MNPHPCTPKPFGRAYLALVAVVLPFCGLIADSPSRAASAIEVSRVVPLIVAFIDETQRMVLRGNTRPEAVRAEFDRGAVDDSFPLNGMQLQLKRAPEHEAAAEALADQLHQRGSPQFHHWLTASEYAERFGVAPEDIATIGAWLRGHGFTVHASPSRMTIDFSGTAGQVREAFGTEIHSIELKGQRHIANVRDPSIPAALSPVIEGIVSLHDFRPRPMIVPRAQYTFTAYNYNFWEVAPADLAKIYQFSPLFAAGITGRGQQIALIEDTNVYDPNDWTTFRNTFGLNVYKGASLTTVHPGGCGDPGVNINDSEAILDAEWASAAAPSAGLQLVSCASTSTTYGGLIAMQNIVNQVNVPPIISYSYGTCESQNGAAANAAQRAVSLQGVLEGVSIFVAAGDTGPDFCDFASIDVSGVTVNGFASTVYDVAVGGTDFGDQYAGTTASYWSSINGATYGSALSYVPEIPWNDSCASTLITNYVGYATPYGANGFCAVASAFFTIPFGGAGGPSNCATGIEVPDNSIPGVAYPSNGTCRGWKKPGWQNVAGNPKDGVRDLPDVSMFAADGVWGHSYVYCYSDLTYGGTPCTGAPSNWSLGGGTSFGTPIMAGMQALVNQVWEGRQGNPNPVFYAIARSEYGAHGNSGCDSSRAGGPAWYCAFNDVTLGDNDTDCIGPYNCYDPDAAAGVIGVLSLSDDSDKPAFKAGVGWDFATGIGTVNATQLVLNSMWFVGAGP